MSNPEFRPTPDLRICEVCNSEPAVGVAAVPGAPLSLAWGRNCLEHGATPLWIAEFNVGQCCHPTEPRWDQIADWFREENVYLNGEYVRVDSLELVSLDCDHSETKAEHISPDGSCPVCYRGKVAGLREVADQQ